MKKLIIVIVIILILGGIGGYFLYYNSMSKPKMLTSNSERVSTCIDTDGTNIYERGYSEYVYLDGTEGELEDVCDFSQQFSKTNVGVVREGYCDGDNFRTELWSCGKGYICRTGRCIEGDSSYSICSDSDGGINEKIKGIVTDVSSEGDRCWVSTNRQNPELNGGYTPDCTNSTEAGCYVYEYYCSDNDLRQYEIINCPNGCLNGACL